MKTLSIIVSALLSSLTLVSGHARIRQPTPLGYDTTPQLTGNAYNAPLAYDGSDFPCKGLIGKVDMTPTAKWQAGGKGMFEIQPNDDPNGGEGQMAAHSGGSCQMSLSYDEGSTFKVVHSYIGGCPRDVPMNSNIGGKNQTFTFDIPENAKAGRAIAAWTWIAKTGNRGEYYMNCASVEIEGSGTSTLDDLPDMFVGELVKGPITADKCLTPENFNFEYPFPGDAVTRADDAAKGLKDGSGPPELCRAPPTSTGPDTPTPPTDDSKPEATSEPSEPESSYVPDVQMPELPSGDLPKGFNLKVQGVDYICNRNT